MWEIAMAARHTRVFGSMASTETGILPAETTNPRYVELLQYKYHESLGHTFRPFANDMYELVHVKSEAEQPFQAVFYTLLGTDTYESSDLYIGASHAERMAAVFGAYRRRRCHHGRTPRKLNPVPYEAVIEKNTSIATALIYAAPGGQGPRC